MGMGMKSPSGEINGLVDDTKNTREKYDMMVFLILPEAIMTYALWHELERNLQLQ